MKQPSGLPKFPCMVMQEAFNAFEIIEYMVVHGNPNSISDAGVGALCIRTAILGAGLNVRINAASIPHDPQASDWSEKARAIEAETIQKEAQILLLVHQNIIPQPGIQ
jgi:glutamate formiminotransferase / formiminotetrahydrofolate cyclodeaminase